ncbi:tigger transposable element-derived protein 1 [Anguilla anguilla]|uniref:tigger transposable element-derived protein 1 n=1 Tax=Anguilla anguilla TaxID=7936 RepID=UPI0015A97832|nr:tigger transposable element-derived protein 1 [Anguilla anguilla]XP_035280509.1 tigger transposable element-derived protein 1 [Anguilla anguilla]
MRRRARTTNRGVPREVLEMATVEVLDKGYSVRAVARTFQICHVTLQRYIKKVMELKAAGTTDTSSIQVGYRSHKQVFQPMQEAALLAYLKEVSGMHYGLSSKEVRKLAFQLAKQNQLKYPEAWNVKEMAGKDWFSSFLKRNPLFPIRRPQPTRAMGFNRENVSNFFQNLGTVLERECLEAKDVWNVDETGVTPVQALEETMATEGSEKTEAIPPGERGTLVTMAVAINAQGNSIPPHLVFPRKRFYRHYIRDAPTGSVGSANGSGRMQEADFLGFLQHFVKHTRASVNFKVLLLLDNHPSHVSASAIDYCDANGVILLTFPPHCAQKLQPLVQGVFGPFRRNLNIAMDCWAKTHPGTPATIYDLPGLIAEALPISATPKNIMAGFRCTGIWPFNSNIFDDEDFTPCPVAARPDPTADVADADLEASFSKPPCLPSTSAGASCPVDLHPFPKPEPCQSFPICRKGGASAFHTDAPVSPAPEAVAERAKEEEDEEVEEDEEEESEPKAKCKAKRKGNKTDLSTEGACPCLFCDDYYLTTVV